MWLEYYENWQFGKQCEAQISDDKSDCCLFKQEIVKFGSVA